MNEKLILTTFRDIISSAVGPRLSTIQGQSGRIPSIVKAREVDNNNNPVPVPDTHYITLDVTAKEYKLNNLIGTVLSQDGNDVYQRKVDYLVTIQCHGEDSDSIINDLSFYLELPFILDKIHNDLSGQIRYLVAPTSLPKSLATQFVETTRLGVILGLTDQYTDNNSYFITDPTNTLTIVK